MKTLVIDIETLPAPEEQRPLIKEIYDKGNEKTYLFEEYYRRTGLNGNFGQLLCIGYAINDETTDILIGKEKDQLVKFWELAKGVDRIIGHHILEFDLPFIMKRSIVNKVKPTRELSFDRYKNMPIYDTKKEWDCWSSAPATSLDTLSKVLGYPTSKQGIDGSQVYDFWKAGKLQEIYDYCKRDVELTRQVYKRLTFTE